MRRRDGRGIERRIGRPRWPRHPDGRRRFPVRLRGRIKVPRRPIPILKQISPADVITLMNFLCGILAVMNAVDGGDGFRKAMIYIMLGTIFDGLDGPVARKFGSSHRFGVWLDSIADAVTFCIAPAILVYNVFKDPSGGVFDSIQNFVVISSSIAIALFGILRLAKFSIYAHKWKDFIGLPTPAMALIVVTVTSSFHFAVLLDIRVEMVTTGLLLVIPVFFFISSLAMVADMRYRKFRGRILVLSGILILLMTIGLLVGSLNEIAGLVVSLINAVLAIFYLLSPLTDGPSRIWGASRWADVYVTEDELPYDELNDNMYPDDDEVMVK